MKKNLTKISIFYYIIYLIIQNIYINYIRIIFKLRTLVITKLFLDDELVTRPIIVPNIRHTYTSL